MSRPFTEFSSLALSIVVGGLYKHYKGTQYKILGIGRHSESLEELVVYQALNGENEIWIRPIEMFIETLSINGQSLPRFQLISENCSR